MSDAPPLGPPPMRGPPPMGPRSALLGPLLAPDATPGALVFGRPRPTQGLMPNMGPRQDTFAEADVLSECIFF
ncbi:hypothetical protein SARC_09229 [Sphaeroforma arctica JP610]|uniref:Uncharacterized protein n=1 Tax=Sphaeroforma arctica JP610 TaxID=667725 RepID=A0A0L0FNF9_9EUKA|nr:hypothetical protein SARC_09229 [Sphaeroforma arctica JP610]KNC78332.1 hypothetical protein SARC_09229 [Sphaeroforma arctica JP610]|eukprot:XP_014152234.1 hypothetical protein SARC_09229 [Sphaeroforma arctica JP610]